MDSGKVSESKQLPTEDDFATLSCRKHIILNTEETERTYPSVPPKQLLPLVEIGKSVPPPITQNTQESPTRRMRLRASRSAKYNLAASWSALTEYLTERGSSTDTGTEGINNRSCSTSGRKRMVRTQEKELSEEESDSDDDYLHDGRSGSKRKRRSQLKRLKHTDARQRNKKRFMAKLTSGDKEVIRGNKPKYGLKYLKGLTRTEAFRLMEYLLETTDWEKAAEYIARLPSEASANLADQGGAEKAERPMPVVKIEAGIAAEPALKISQVFSGAQPKATSPDHLREHWKDTLSKRMVELYVD
ncbi:hypothetical protein MMC19_003968 [Ptychographa xylographoides]|nr:hypothetical protein [Ptychographa xylographoides]